MRNLYRAAEYKHKIINLLLKNEDLITLIAPAQSKYDEIDVIDVLLGGRWIIDGKEVTEQGHIFDYNFVDNVTDDEKTFIMVETDIGSIEKRTFADFNLYICVFTKKNLVKLTSSTTPTAEQVKNMGYFAGHFANRIDVLCDIIESIINENPSIKGIGDVSPADYDHVAIYTPNVNYYGKCLKYHIRNLNEGRDEC